jgi:hypothetical protein
LPYLWSIKLKLKPIFLAFFFSLFLILTSLAQTVGMRALPYDDLTLRADLILRARVKKVEKANYLATYTQLVTLDVADMVKGDIRLKELKVWSGSQVINASDSFNKGTELLLFVVREQTFYRLLNFQYGMFAIENETVKAWREPRSTPVIAPTPSNNANSSNPTNNPNNPLAAPSLPTERPMPYTIVDKSYNEVRRDIETTLRNLRR